MNGDEVDRIVGLVAVKSMLMCFGGGERTVDELAALAADSGCAYARSAESQAGALDFTAG